MQIHQIRGKLLSAGYTFSSWATENGYESRTVAQSVNRWAGKSGCPRGLTREILEKLGQLIGQPLFTFKAIH